MKRITNPVFPSGSTAERVKFFLQYGVLAPSTHNTQPWKFKIKGDRLTILPDRSKALPQADPTTRNLFVSLGACVENIAIAADQYGYEAVVTSATGDAIQVTFKQVSTTPSPDQVVLDAIEQRHSHKFPYKPDAVLPEHLAAMHVRHIPGAEIVFIEKEDTIRAVAALHQLTIEKLGKNNLFGRELAGWLRDNSGRHADGMPGMVTGIKGPGLYLLRALIKRVPKMITILGKKDYAVLSTSPLIGIVATGGNATSDWVNAGRVYEATAISATIQGVNSAPLTAMMEDADAVSQLKKIFNLKSKTPQVFLRFGYGTHEPVYAPRRHIDEVLQ